MAPKEKERPYRAQTDPSELRDSLAQKNYEGLLPPQFLKGPFPKIGGRARLWGRSENFQGGGFVFPQPDRNITRWYAPQPNEIHHTEIGYLVSDFRQEKHEREILFDAADIQIVHPSTEDAKKIEQSQLESMGRNYDKDSVYPWDLWMPKAGPMTQFSAIDRKTGDIAGFLLGFYGKNRDDAWLESQIMGVVPMYREKGVAKALKLMQRKEAFQKGINEIRWTFDPLKVPNAKLNLNVLGAEVETFWRAYYQSGAKDNSPIPESRFRATWNIGSALVRDSLDHTRVIPTFTQVMDEKKNLKILYPTAQNYDAFTPEEGVPYLVNIPADWSQMKDTDPDQACEWRRESDMIFERLLSPDAEGYKYHRITTLIEDQKENKPFYYVYAEPLFPKYDLIYNSK